MEISSHNEKIKNEEFEIDISQLPTSREGWFKSGLTLYQGCWYISKSIPNIISFQINFQPQDQDIVFSSNPKSGTTWMKALLFSILNRDRYNSSNTPLLVSNPHDLVPSFEYTLYSDPPKHEIADISSPRLFSTHVAYESLPELVLSKSRVVYICRNPLDTIVSFWHFVSRYDSGTGSHWSIEECVDAFCRGESGCGPFWVHVLGFWKASLENPEKVLFLKYEDLLEDPDSHVKRVAEFLGFPFSEEEERLGVVEQIVELCSIGNMKSLDVNKTGKLAINGEIGGDIFFRKGKLGDWVNHLSPSLVKRVNEVIDNKLSGSGLSFNYSL